MNQRFQNEEIGLVSEQYADNELYKAVRSIGQQLESEMEKFGLCPEECFMESLELLSVIADKGEEILPELDDLWLRKHNEYKRFDRSVSEDEIRKAVGIVFGFAILATDSSRHPFYRRTLSERLMETIATYQFQGWPTTLKRIFSVPLPDGWFDAFIEEEPDGGIGVTEHANSIGLLRRQMPNTPLIVQFVNKQYNNGCQQFMGNMEKPQFITSKQDEAV